MYNVKSNHADEFIDDSEILETLAYAEKNKSNRALIEQIIDKASLCKGLTHREAAVLLDCDQPDLIERYEQLAKDVKRRFYGNRIVMFAPLYLSNYCINGCVYCPYHAKNKTIPRKKLSQEEIRAEVEALVKMGHKRIALEAGEHPVMNPLEYILESIHTIYNTKVGNGEIRRLNVNIAATEVEAYEKLKASVPTSCSRRPITARTMRPCIPPVPRATTAITPRRWIVPSWAVVTMWASAYCMD